MRLALPRSNRYRRWLAALAALLLALALLFAFRHALLRGIGGWLVVVDAPTRVDAVFVLSGRPVERAQAAAAVLRNGNTPVLICTGEIRPEDFQALGLPYTEAELTRAYLLALGVDSNAVRLLPKGTSTQEELLAIRTYCHRQRLTRIGILSSELHTRRIRRQVGRLFDQDTVDVLVFGAPPVGYSVAEWWRSEEGLIFVVNEYAKLGYYVLNY